MHVEITHKIPQGKLVRISLDFDTTILQNIKICGDFFIHPEETIEEMERALYHLPVETAETRIQQLLDRAVHTKNAQLIGVDTQNIAKLIHEAIYQ